MFTTNDLSFFERRLTVVLRELVIRNYDEDYDRGEISFTIVGPVSITDETVEQIRGLFGAAAITLTPVGSSLNIVAREVVFQFIH